MSKKSPLAVAMLAFLPLASPAFGADPHIRLIASTCLNCHGPGGKSLGAVPGLAGQDQAYLLTAMKEQRSGARETTVMRRYMNGYTEDEMAKLAEYFSGLK
jgi:sulfide dehydrogenase cytochrome subunit